MTDRPKTPENNKSDDPATTSDVASAGAGGAEPSAIGPAASEAAPAVPDPSTIPQAVVAPRWHAAPWLVWLIPIIAAAIGGWILAHSIMTRGPTITIVFKNAEGLEAGKTKIKYKEVDIGVVKSIALTKDRTRVVVTAELAKGSDSFLREDTRFWVVRPRIGAGGISGLSTLLSGSYIGLDVGKSEEERDDFVGLDVAPLVLTDLPGRRFVLHAEHMGSLDAGSSIYFRRIEVGQVVGYELDKQGKLARQWQAGGRQPEAVAKPSKYDNLQEAIAEDEAAEARSKSASAAPDKRKVEYMKGRIVGVACPSTAGATLTVESAGREWKIDVADRNNATLIGVERFDCGWSGPSASINYKRKGNLAGDLVSLELN